MAEPTIAVAVTPAEETPQSGSSPSDGQLEQAERLGQALERLNRLEQQLTEATARLEGGEADRAEVARLQARVTQLEGLLEEVEEEIEETESDVTVIAPPPPPPPPEAPEPKAEEKKKSWVEKLCFGEW
jgi:outer membrane protein TolC